VHTQDCASILPSYPARHCNPKRRIETQGIFKLHTTRLPSSLYHITPLALHQKAPSPSIKPIPPPSSSSSPPPLLPSSSPSPPLLHLLLLPSPNSLSPPPPTLSLPSPNSLSPLPQISPSPLFPSPPPRPPYFLRPSTHLLPTFPTSAGHSVSSNMTTLPTSSPLRSSRWVKAVIAGVQFGGCAQEGGIFGWSGLLWVGGGGRVW